jgi:hypothetical protein
MKLYINGALDKTGQSSCSSIFNIDYPAFIGAYSNQGSGLNYFDGAIDDVRIYDRALSIGEVQQLYQEGSAGLVAHWKFDEGSGGIATDSAGTNDGTLINGPAWTDGQIGGALDFNGVDDYVDIGSIAGTDPLALAGSNFTIVCWIRPALTGNDYQRIVDKSNDHDGMNGYIVYVHTDGKLSVGVNLNSFWSNSSVITANTWQQIAVTADGSNYRLYVDGETVSGSFAAGSYDSPPAVTTNMRIGAWNHAPDRRFNGAIDDVRIYDRALSDTEVQQLYQEGSAGLVAHWKFDETSGTTAYDSAGSNNGTLVNGPVWTTGQIDGALDFDGVNDYVQVADQPIFDTGDKLTVANWFKTTTNQSVKGMVTHDSSDYKYMTYLTSNSGIIQFYIRQSSGPKSASTDDLGSGYWADGQWHLVVGVFDRSLPNNRSKLYVDGQLAGVRDVPDENILPGDEGIIIGKWYTGHEFHGTIDDVRIYDRALSATKQPSLVLLMGQQ